MASRWARLKGTTVYQPTEVEGAEVSFSFNLDKSQSYDGLTAYDGKIYVVDAFEDSYLVIFKSEIAPSMQIGLSFAKSHIKRSVDAIFSGMFQ